MAKLRMWEAETPQGSDTKLCMPGNVHDIHASQFWWWSVKGCWRGEGSNFRLFHRLASSPLQHSRTTVEYV